MMIWERLSQSKPYNKASRKQPPFKSYRNYRKIPKICPGAYIFQRPFLRGLFSEGLIFGRAYARREICVSKSIGQACSGKEIIRGQIPSTSSRGAYFRRGDLTEGCLRYDFGGLIFGGAYFRNFSVSSLNRTTVVLSRGQLTLALGRSWAMISNTMVMTLIGCL